ncbi:MAG: hypothetical protein GY792_28165, partial [Gammaproteobacteria bacterium]|nr:hypothetical protein [Gammaproteobacteria bacterium]
MNIPHFSSEVTWAEAAIFWFGENESHTHIPGRNYTDVRTAYTNDGLHIRFTVIDYYLWSNNDPQPADDLTLYDAAAIYLDTNGNGGTAPQTDDYTFLVGARHYPTDNAPEYHRQARGTGAGWDTNWEETWTDQESMQWSNCGPNDNGCNIDYGWTAIFNIPWAALSLSGPPAEGVVWGFAVQLHDRDDNPPAGYVSPEYWPETFNANSPATWGELHFGEANYQPPTGTATGTTVIRASSQEDNTVEDAWMGGGGV